MTDHEQILSILDYSREEGIFDGSYSSAKETLAEAGLPHEKLRRYMDVLHGMERAGELRKRYEGGLSPNRGAGPEGGGRGVPRGPRIDWRFKGRDTTQMLFVTKEPDGEYYLWHEAYGKKPDWTYSFSKKPDAIAALNEQAGHSHRPNSSTLEPNRNLTRFQLERLLADQGLSRSEISGMTDDQLRRAVGHDKLVAAGDLNRNGDDMTRNARRREEPDEHAARELSLFIENEYSLVGAPNSQGKAIEKNLLAKIKKGTFDLALSEKAWMYLMETGAKKYAADFGDGPGGWSKMFNKPTRELVAHEFATTFAEENGVKLARNSSSDYVVEDGGGEFTHQHLTREAAIKIAKREANRSGHTRWVVGPTGNPIPVRPD